MIFFVFLVNFFGIPTFKINKFQILAILLITFGATIAGM